MEGGTLSVFGARLFPGGVHPREGENGKAVNGGNAIRELPAPPRVIIPLQQHIGAPAKPLVKKGDRVLTGQKIGDAGGFVSAPVHASVSGTVVDVQPALLANGTAQMAVIIDNDYKDEWVQLTPAEHPETLSAAELQYIIREAGIVGMGGAGFPTAVKLTPGTGKTIEKLIINGAECEPYLTADHRLMLEQAAGIVDGIRLTMLALEIKEAIVGIEDNKADAIAVMTEAASHVEGLTVRALPVKYPQGGEKQLVYALTRRKVPAGGLPLDVGCVVMNVGTCYAVHQAVREGRPLISRVTTVGGLVNNPGNFLVRVGCTVENLLEACGGIKPETKQLLYGGPMMGMAIARTDIPVTKACSGILALGQAAMEPKESACIRCGRCINACPMNLMPAKIDAFARVNDFESAEKFGAMNCMECGVCTYTCPAKRSLTQSCRTAKKVITTRRQREAARKQAEEAAQKAQAAADSKAIPVEEKKEG
ncbi:MAG: electron transport complex subunit RsxC [Christensenellaceae bacterium]|nr:electron transport complex subunit RsxC [Christensenellaceae bacterium]